MNIIISGKQGSGKSKISYAITLAATTWERVSAKDMHQLLGMPIPSVFIIEECTSYSEIKKIADGIAYRVSVLNSMETLQHTVLLVFETQALIEEGMPLEGIEEFTIINTKK